MRLLRLMSHCFNILYINKQLVILQILSRRVKWQNNIQYYKCQHNGIGHQVFDLFTYFGLNITNSSSTSISLAFNSFLSIRTVLNSFSVNRGRFGSCKTTGHKMYQSIVTLALQCPEESRAINISLSITCIKPLALLGQHAGNSPVKGHNCKKPSSSPALQL